MSLRQGDGYQAGSCGTNASVRVTDGRGPAKGWSGSSLTVFSVFISDDIESQIHLRINRNSFTICYSRCSL